MNYQFHIPTTNENISKGLSYLIKKLEACQAANGSCEQCEKFKPCLDLYDSHCNRPISTKKAKAALTQILQLHLKIPDQKEAIN